MFDKRRLDQLNKLRGCQSIKFDALLPVDQESNLVVGGSVKRQIFLKSVAISIAKRNRLGLESKPLYIREAQTDIDDLGRVRKLVTAGIPA